MVAVGTQLGEAELWRDPPLPLSGDVVRIDIDPAQRHKNALAAVAITADATEGLAGILASFRDGSPRDRGAGQAGELRSRLAAEAREDGRAYAELIAALEATLDDDSILAGDSTMACYYGAVHLLSRSAPRRFLYPSGFAPLGYGIPAGSVPGWPIPRARSSRWSATAARCSPSPSSHPRASSAPLAVVVVNDGGYGEIRRQMLDLGQPPLGVDLASPDFAAVARGLGGRGHALDDPGDLPALLADRSPTRCPP